MNVTATYPDGSTREMPEEHAKILQHVGKITDYSVRQVAPQSYMTRDMQAVRAPEPVVPEAPVPRRRGRPPKPKTVEPVEQGTHAEQAEAEQPEEPHQPDETAAE